MGSNDRFHIDPATGSVEKCRTSLDRCRFGGLDQHFRDSQYPPTSGEEKALRALRAKAQTFYDWTIASHYPQEPGWITEYVFDPAYPETYRNKHVFFSKDIPTGTKLVIENGWVFEKLGFGDYWEMKAGEERPGGMKYGQPMKYYPFLEALENFGGRLEFRDGVEPIKINWRVDPQAVEREKREREEFFARLTQRPKRRWWHAR